MSDSNLDLLGLTSRIVSAHVSTQRIGSDEVPGFLESVHATLAKLSGGAEERPQASEPEAPEYTPAVSVRKSLASPDHIISMIDGKPYKTLRRHLARHGLTAEEYRARYRLKADYPIVAASYSQARRDMAKMIGLGRKAALEPAVNAKSAQSRAPKPMAEPSPAPSQPEVAEG